MSGIASGTAETDNPTETETTPVEASTTEDLIEVDGQMFTIEELKAGHMRQADYTRKTQELANASKLMEAWTSNPAETAKILAERAGLTLGDGNVDEYEEPLDPVEAEVNALKAQVQELRTSRAQETYNAELNHLAEKYGDLVDREAVLQHAVNIGATSLESAFKDMTFDTVMTRTKAEAAAEEDAQEKRDLAGSVATGTATPAAAGGAPEVEVSSMEDAKAQTLSQLRASGLLD